MELIKTILVFNLNKVINNENINQSTNYIDRLVILLEDYILPNFKTRGFIGAKSNSRIYSKQFVTKKLLKKICSKIFK